MIDLFHHSIDFQPSQDASIRNEKLPLLLQTSKFNKKNVQITLKKLYPTKDKREKSFSESLIEFVT
jgi:hypothetical protein